jgi:hypothetical protein
MTDWWTSHDAAIFGSIGGSVLGVTCGIYGTLIGLFAHKGIGRRALIGFHVAVVVLGLVGLVAGIGAVIARQPYHVYYPLLLIGGIATFVMGGLLPMVILRYRQAESRKMDAQLLRKG